MDIPDAFVREVVDIVDEVRPLLAGKHPPIIGAALAQLTAMWISHHLVLTDSAEDQQKLWTELLDMHIDMTRQLIKAIISNDAV